MKKNIYFEDLDGLRGVASAMVMFYHFALAFTLNNNPEYAFLFNFFSFKEKGGVIAVDFFFVLSGFLISYLLFVERNKTGKINIPHFYIRRVLRIWPLYFLTLFLGFVFYPYIKHLQGWDVIEYANPLMCYLFLANFDLINNAPPSVGILGVHWSVSVEEQFCLFWPVLFVLIMMVNRKVFPFVLVVFYLFSEIYIYLNGTAFGITYFHTISCIRFLSVGCLIGYLSFYYLEHVKKILAFIPRYIVLFLYLLFIFIVFFEFLFSNLLCGQTF